MENDPAPRRLARLAGYSRGAAATARQRLLFLAGGVGVGAAAVLMALLADHAQRLFRDLVGLSPLVALVVTPAGFALAALLARTVFPNAGGSGIPQVIAARHLHEGAARETLVSLRVAFGKIVVMTFGLVCGASTGREGPTVQVGAAIMHAAGRFVPERQRGLLLAGGAAGVAAAFNTPLAGIVFGIEELSREFETRTSGLILGAIIAAGLTALAFAGNYTYFGSTAAILPLGRAWLVVPVSAVIGGLAGGLFSRIAILVLRDLPARGTRLTRRPVLLAALCGLGVALCGLAGHGSVAGTGYDEARAIIHGTGETGPAFAPLKLVATLLSAMSGIPGGLFAPSLAVGAGLGADLALLFTTIPIGALALIGMVSYLTGVLQAPITAFVIVSEMTENHAMVIPLMAAAVIADAVSKLVCREGLYHALAAPLIAKLAPEARG